MDFSQYIQYVNDSADERAANYQTLLDNARQQSVPVEVAPSNSGDTSGSFNGKALEEIQNLQEQENVQKLKDGNKIPLCVRVLIILLLLPILQYTFSGN